MNKTSASNSRDAGAGDTITSDKQVPALVEIAAANGMDAAASTAHVDSMQGNRMCRVIGTPPHCGAGFQPASMMLAGWKPAPQRAHAIALDLMAVPRDRTVESAIGTDAQQSGGCHIAAGHKRWGRRELGIHV